MWALNKNVYDTWKIFCVVLNIIWLLFVIIFCVWYYAYVHVSKCACVFMSIHTSVSMYVDARGWCIFLQPLFFEARSIIVSRADNLAGLTGLWPPEVCLPCLYNTEILGTAPHLFFFFFLSVWDPNTGAHACMGDPWLNEPFSLAPFWLLLIKMFVAIVVYFKLLFSRGNEDFSK